MDVTALTQALVDGPVGRRLLGVVMRNAPQAVHDPAGAQILDALIGAVGSAEPEDDGVAVYRDAVADSLGALREVVAKAQRDRFDDESAIKDRWADVLCAVQLGTSRPSRIAKLLGITGGAVSKIVRDLRSAGLVAQAATDGSDGRARPLHLTHDGERLLDRQGARVATLQSQVETIVSLQRMIVEADAPVSTAQLTAVVERGFAGPASPSAVAEFFVDEAEAAGLVWRTPTGVVSALTRPPVADDESVFDDLLTFATQGGELPQGLVGLEAQLGELPANTGIVVLARRDAHITALTSAFLSRPALKRLDVIEMLRLSPVASAVCPPIGRRDFALLHLYPPEARPAVPMPTFDCSPKYEFSLESCAVGVAVRSLASNPGRAPRLDLHGFPRRAAANTK